ncbi:MAG: NAD-dependent epimerase/dehydratase family protein [Polyangiales bacterium]
MRVLIAGCGYVGMVLAARLQAAGHSVWGLRRRAFVVPAGVQALQADLGRSDLAAVLPPALDAVVYAASADARTPAAYQAAYVAGLARLVDLLVRRGDALQRLLFVSSTAVYGENAGGWVDERSPCQPAGFTGEVLLAAEAAAAAAPWPSSVLRLGGIYGPGRTRLLRQVASGVPCPAPETHWTNRIHRDDAAAALAHLLTLPALQPCYVGVDTAPVQRRVLWPWLRQALVAAGQMPEGGVAGTESVAAAARAATALPAATGKRCASDRLRHSGLTLQYPSFREGYGAMTAALAPGALQLPSPSPA